MSETRELVLLVDDDPSFCTLIQRILEKSGYAVKTVGDGESCLAVLAEILPSAVLLDLTLPGIQGLEVLSRIKEHHPYLPVIMLTAHTNLNLVVKAIQLGAYDYLSKPPERTELITTVSNALERHRMASQIVHLEREASGGGYKGILGQSAVMKELFRQMDRVAGAEITALIHGESGTGKELVANAIHESSSRSAGPFVALNCAAIPEALQESELFGHEKGSFTGASERRIGKIERAHRGTLFLDEVAELSPSLQAKLLRVLQEKSFHRLGGDRDVHSDFRLLAATHRELSEEVRAGRFREDLYYRIAVFVIELPPLRERSTDIPILARAFLESYASKKGAGIRFSNEALETLGSYHWPGNVRELQNAIQHALVVAGGREISSADLPKKVRSGTTGDSNLTDSSEEAAPETTAVKSAEGEAEAEPPSQRRTAEERVPTLEEIERDAIRAAIDRNPDSLSQAIRELDIGRATFYRKTAKYGLRPVSDESRH